MSSLNLPAIKRGITIDELRNFVLRLSEEIGYALDEMNEAIPLENDANLKSNRALFLSEELKSLINMQSGENHISFGSVSVCFGRVSVSASSPQAVTLPISYTGDYFAVLTPTGDNCNGASLYTKSKQKTGFTVVVDGGTGNFSADYITVGLRKGG